MKKRGGGRGRGLSGTWDGVGGSDRGLVFSFVFHCRLLSVCYQMVITSAQVGPEDSSGSMS